MEAGFAFPLRPDDRGGLQGAAEAVHLRDSLLALLSTQPGERLMRPDYGCQLRSLLFEPCTSQTANLARFYVADAIARWEPRAALVEVEVHPIPDGEWRRAGYAMDPLPAGPGLFIEIRYSEVGGGGTTEVLAFGVPLA